jgi:hypothetical protein
MATILGLATVPPAATGRNRHRGRPWVLFILLATSAWSQTVTHDPPVSQPCTPCGADPQQVGPLNATPSPCYAVNLSANVPVITPTWVAIAGYANGGYWQYTWNWSFDFDCTNNPNNDTECAVCWETELDIATPNGWSETSSGGPFQTAIVDCGSSITATNTVQVASTTPGRQYQMLWWLASSGGDPNDAEYDLYAGQTFIGPPYGGVPTPTCPN